MRRLVRTPIVSLATLVAVTASVVAGCGSSTSSSSSTTVVVTTTTPSATIPDALRPVCALFDEAVPIDSLQPTNASNWAAEQQRVVTAATRDADLYEQATPVAPPAIAKQLPALVAYSRAVSAATGSASSFSSATTAIGAYPDKVGASLAMSTVESWKRTNCKG